MARRSRSLPPIASCVRHRWMLTLMGPSQGTENTEGDRSLPVRNLMRCVRRGIVRFHGKKWGSTKQRGDSNPCLIPPATLRRTRQRRLG